MIARLEEVNTAVSNKINQSMFLADTARPGARQETLERLRLATGGALRPKLPNDKDRCQMLPIAAQEQVFKLVTHP